jgi:hypothetical protein
MIKTIRKLARLFVIHAVVFVCCVAILPLVLIILGFCSLFFSAEIIDWNKA